MAKTKNAGSINEMRQVFPNSDTFNHMPFLVDEDTLVFCRAGPPIERRFITIHTPNRPSQLQQGRLTAGVNNTALYRPWKLFVNIGTTDKPSRLETGLPDDAVECCPTVFRKSGRLHVNFVAGRPGSTCMVYNLYAMEGESLVKLSPAQPIRRTAVRIGCAGPDYVCFADADGFTVVKSQGMVAHYRCSLARLARISFMAEDPDNLLLTGVDIPPGSKTLVYGLKTGEVREIQAETPVYKSSIFGKHLVMAQSIGPGIEPYQLMTATYTLVTSTETVSLMNKLPQHGA